MKFVVINDHCYKEKVKTHVHNSNRGKEKDEDDKWDKKDKDDKHDKNDKNHSKKGKGR
ncbi:MAG: hypothetical protein H6Q50_558 [Deltaproteobacteria bacterium]|jgi:hypothetical protein|nr:hypothetical protein [Deltaproteobacteria bacterium]